MSIYCSFGCLDGDSKRPIIYQGSNILPHGRSKRGGSVDLAFIPDHISRGTRKRDDAMCWPWLRVGVAKWDNDAGETVVLDYNQVIELRDSLTWWLENAGGKS